MVDLRCFSKQDHKGHEKRGFLSYLNGGRAGRGLLQVMLCDASFKPKLGSSDTTSQQHIKLAKLDSSWFKLKGRFASKENAWKCGQSYCKFLKSVTFLVPLQTTEYGLSLLSTVELCVQSLKPSLSELQKSFCSSWFTPPVALAMGTGSSCSSCPCFAFLEGTWQQGQQTPEEPGAVKGSFICLGLHTAGLSKKCRHAVFERRATGMNGSMDFKWFV